jgi:uncharacterized protein (TIGR02284 family)
MADNIVSVLNELIETSKDGERGFTKSAADTTNPELKSVFSEGARRCREGIQELQGLVRAQGGDPDKAGSVSGALHRGWVSLREAVTNRDDEAILEEVERGEDYAKKQYREALEKDLPASIRDVIDRQYRGVIANHDRVRALRDRFHASHASR